MTIRMARPRTPSSTGRCPRRLGPGLALAGGRELRGWKHDYISELVDRADKFLGGWSRQPNAQPRPARAW